MAVCGRPQNGAELLTQQLGAIEAQANAPLAQEGVRFGGHFNVGQWLVAANVERSHDNGLPLHRLGNRFVNRELLFFGGGFGAVQEEKFGAEQTHPFGSRLHRFFSLGQAAHVGHNFDAVAILGGGGVGRCLGGQFPLALPFALRRLRLGENIARGVEGQRTLAAV